MVSLVVVSHSAALARAALDLAEQMVPAESRPEVRLASGLGGQTLGTDAAAIAEALESVDSRQGVLVLVDLGSAVLSAELALDLVEAELAERVVISPAPIVEGLVAALVTAAGGASLERVDAEARASLRGKIDHLGEREIHHPAAPPEPAAPERLEFEWLVTNEHGLHARPAAALASTLAGFDADVWVRNASAGGEAVPGDSVSRLATLGLARGDRLQASITGPDAAEALAALKSLAERGFGDLSVDPAPDEARRLAQARALVASTIEALPARGSAAQILQAVAQLVNDPALTRAMGQHLEAGTDAREAARLAHHELAQRFEQLPNSYLALRAQDVRAIGALVDRALAGGPLLAELGSGTLVMDELDAVTAARLDAERTPRVVVRAPGDEAHGPIIARSLGVEVVTGQQA